MMVVDGDLANAEANEAGKSESSKRKIDGDTRDTHPGQATTSGARNNNKRRKKNNKKKSKPASKHSKNRHAKNNQRNWIESCGESVNRVPANCTAPLTCLITRVEIDEEPLLPKKRKGEDHLAEQSTKEGIAVQDVDDGPKLETENSTEHTRIARPSDSFLAQYIKKPTWQLPSSIAKGGEEKKLFIPVKRHESSKGSTKWAQERKKNGGGDKDQYNFVHLPNGDNGDGITNPYPTSVVPDKFWAQRKRLFSRYDEGITIGDCEMWYSVTPEAIANHIAGRIIDDIVSQRNMYNQQADATESKSANDAIHNKNLGEDEKVEPNESRCKIVVLDLFCGVGGNSIALSRLNQKQELNCEVTVVAVDNCLSRLQMAANNAAIYEIEPNNIRFIHADAVEVLHQFEHGNRKRCNTIPRDDQQLNVSGYQIGGLGSLPEGVDAIFLSPPWGGMSYDMTGKAGYNPAVSISIEHKVADDSQITTNGGEILAFAAKAVLEKNGTSGSISYFLPRNTDGVSLGQSAVASGLEGCFEMEQNVVNGKVKTVTAYFGPGIGRETAPAIR